MRLGSNHLVRQAVGILLLTIFLPVLLAAVARAVSDVLGPIIPYIVVLLILLGLYRLVLGIRR